VKIVVDLAAMRAAATSMERAAEALAATAGRCAGISLPPESPQGARADIAAAAQRCRKASRDLHAQSEALRRRIRLVELAEQAALSGNPCGPMLLMLAVASDKALTKIGNSGLLAAGSLSVTAVGYFVQANELILKAAATAEYLRYIEGGAKDLQMVLKGADVTMEWAGKLGKLGKGLSVVGGVLTFVGAWATSSSTQVEGKLVTAGFTTAGTIHPAFAAVDLVTGAGDGKGTGVVGGAGDFYGSVVDGVQNRNLIAIEEWNRKNLSGEHGYVFKQYALLGDQYLPAAASSVSHSVSSAHSSAVDATGGFLDKQMGKNWPFDGDGRPW
jgi:hypothetical protein